MAGVGGAAVPGRLSPAFTSARPTAIFSYKKLPAYEVIERLPKVSLDGGIMLIPPTPPLRRVGNDKELLLKSPFEKGGLRGI